MPSNYTIINPDEVYKTKLNKIDNISKRLLVPILNSKSLLAVGQVWFFIEFIYMG